MNECIEDYQRLLNGFSLEEDCFEQAKSEFLSAFRHYKGHSYELNEILDVIKGASTIDDLIGAAAMLNSNPRIWAKYIPARFGLEFEEELNDIYVIHFTNEDNLKYIKEEGFKGPAETKGLFYTYGPLRGLNKKRGYLFGYMLEDVTDLREAYRLASTILMGSKICEYYNDSDYDDSDYDDSAYGESVDEVEYPNWQCTARMGLIFKVSHAIKVYHSFDDESQIIFPISCIVTPLNDIWTLDMDMDLV